MQGTVNIEFDGTGFLENPKRTHIKSGPLLLPDGVSVPGGLVAFGENDDYLHCIVVDTGSYYGVSKSHDSDHLFQHLLRLNAVGA